MEAYIYQAALLCEDCGITTRRSIIEADNAPDDPSDESTYDSDDFPKGPYADGGGEADCPQHCDQCGVFLENPLTQEGYKYIREEIAANVQQPNFSGSTAKEWLDFYGEDL